MAAGREGGAGRVAAPAGGRGRGAGSRASGAFIEGRGDWSAFEAVELAGPGAGRRARGAPEGTGGDVYAWAWIDEAAGTVRARSFAPDFGIPEDEATGSAALGLAVELGRELTIHQGRGSVLLARALGGGRGEVGGGSRSTSERDYRLSAGG